jgi:hypothetical protein
MGRGVPRIGVQGTEIGRGGNREIRRRGEQGEKTA